jgi:hypothetical protein
MTAFVNRYTKAPLRFIAGLSLLVRAFDDPYFNLEGRFLEALARLLTQNVRINAYPMAPLDLREASKDFSVTDLQWTETNGCVSAEQLHFKPSQSPLRLSSRRQLSRPHAHDLGPARGQSLTAQS